MATNSALYTYQVTVTDGAEITLYAQTPLCGAVYAQEDPTQAGWPHAFLVRGMLAGSVQVPQTGNSIYRFPATFAAGTALGKLQLVNGGGVTTVFNISECPV